MLPNLYTNFVYNQLKSGPLICNDYYKDIVNSKNCAIINSVRLPVRTKGQYVQP